MSRRGYVYMLSNPAMPHYYKIGQTAHTPQRRAAELSARTCVPEPFRVVCCIEVADRVDVERHLHSFLADFRPNFEREFFMFRDEHLAWVIGLFAYHPQLISFWRRTPHYQVPESVEAINPWPADGSDPAMTDHPPIAFLDVEPV